MRDDYAAEARDEHVTKLDNVLYIIIALVNIKTSKYLSKTNEVWNKARGWKKIHNPYVSFDIVTFAIYSNNNCYMVVGEISVFFQCLKRTARCKCTILSMWAVFLLFFFLIVFFFTWSWIRFFFKGNSSCNEKLLYYNIRNWIGFPASWVSVQWIYVFNAPL